MVWAGNDKPCGTATLMSIGCLGVEQNKKHASVLYPIIEKELGIPGDRFVYLFCIFFFCKVLIILQLFLDYT